MRIEEFCLKGVKFLKGIYGCGGGGVGFADEDGVSLYARTGKSELLGKKPCFYRELMEGKGG